MKKFKALAKTNNRFLSNLGWLGISGGVIRVTRLLATVILARFLSPDEYGLAAIVMTVNDLIRVFIRTGIGTRLVQAKAEEVPQLAQSAYWLNWTISLGLFILQCLAAFPIASFYHNEKLILPICHLWQAWLVQARFLDQ